MSLERVKQHLKKYGLDGKIILCDESSATVALAAAALGCEEARIAKTLSFDTPDGCVLVVTAGDARVNNGKFKRFFGCKANMVKHDDVEEKIGHAVGGVCPFGVNDGVRVYLDESLKRFETVFPACGSSNSAIELTLDELEKVSEYIGWVDVCNRRQEQDGAIQSAERSSEKAQ